MHGDAIVRGIATLQCDSVACKPKPMRQWYEWTARHLPEIVRQSQGCSACFCLLAHRQFLETSRHAKFGDWRWDFLTSLFEGGDCNCVCGTLFLAAAAEWAGLLLPDDSSTGHGVQVMVGPQHVWIRARGPQARHCQHVMPCRGGTMDPDNWFIIETTLRPRAADSQQQRQHAQSMSESMYFLTQQMGRQRDIYGRGAWMAYRGDQPHLIVQEAFVNQLLLSPHDSHHRKTMLILLGQQVLPADSTSGSSVTAGESPWILDLRKLRIRQLTSQQCRQRPSVCQHQLRLAESMLDTIERGSWPVEAYMKSVAFIVKWYCWWGMCCDDMASTTLRPLDAHQSKLRGRGRCRALVHQLRQRLQQGHWTRRCPSLDNLWTQITYCMRLWNHLKW
jgi:hypothetical protein